MNRSDVILDCTVITSRPALIQQDCLDVNPQAREYITAGVPCNCTPMLLELLKAHIRDSRKGSMLCIVIMLVFAGVMLMCFFSECAAMILEHSFRVDGEGVSISWAIQPGLLTMPAMAVGLIVLSILLIRRRDHFLRVIEEAERGNILCFRYAVRDILRYEYRDTDGDPVYEYYADLGGFAVKLSQKKKYSRTATGVLAQAGGKEYFFFVM
ncbi:MAG: hypothetical protein ACI4WS_10255 [Oscillospiraceae bacterium]